MTNAWNHQNHQNRVKFAQSIRAYQYDKNVNLTDHPFTNIQCSFNLNSIDGSKKESIEKLMIDFENEVFKNQLTQLDESLEKQISLLRHMHSLHMTKIPESARTMKVKDLNDQLGIDLVKELTDVFEKFGQTAIINSKSPTTGSMRLGENVFTSSGSSINDLEVGEVTAQIRKKNKDNNGEAVFGINVGNGKLIEIEHAGDIDNLEESFRCLAVQQLHLYQEKLFKIINSLPDQN